MRKNAKSTKHRKLRDFLAVPGGSPAGGAAPLSYGEERNAFGNATARGPLAGLSAYARQPARGPTMWPILWLCWPLLAYVGLSCGQCGPILWLCWPMIHVEPKDPKNGNSKKTL